jgi:hypothetical protein
LESTGSKTCQIKKPYYYLQIGKNLRFKQRVFDDEHLTWQNWPITRSTIVYATHMGHYYETVFISVLSCQAMLPTPGKTFRPNQPKHAVAGKKVRPLIKYTQRG